MNNPVQSQRPVTTRGIYSMVLSSSGALLVFYFASGAGTGVTYSRGVITFAQYLLLLLLGYGLVSGVAGVVRREKSRWLSAAGLIVSLCITAMTALFFHSLDD